MATSRVKVIVYVGDGSGTCQGAEEATYLRQTLESITAWNKQRAQIHCIGISSRGQIREDFLKKLAEANGGTYTRIDN
jgi:Mg-chelatase subunit ChlD